MELPNPVHNLQVDLLNWPSLCLVTLDLSDSPHPWVDFLAWPRACLITMVLSYELDSWLDLATPSL